MMSVEVLTGPEGQSVPGQTTEELSELPQFPHSTLCVQMRPKGLYRLEPACGKAISALLGRVSVRSLALGRRRGVGTLLRPGLAGRSFRS